MPRLKTTLPVTAIAVSDKREFGVGAYDDGLLEKVRKLWRMGEWESLSNLDLPNLEKNPDRAKLSLLVASSWLQQGDSTAARRYLRHAMDWDCDKVLAAQILTASVHNTLGRAAAIAGDHARMEQHFRNAVSRSGSQIESDSLDRRNVELQRLGLVSTGLGITPAEPSALYAQENPIINYPPHGITSYAQNFEDVILWRALWHVEKGFYIDVGAFDPVIDSVSKAFYENGWRGCHVEPLVEYAEKIRLDRPDERVYQCPLASETGVIDFYELYGISTGIKNVAIDNSKSLNQNYKFTKKNAITLSEIFEDAGSREIHWMKIDVEGMEGEVLSGWSGHNARPWIVVVEATKPLESTQTWMVWDFHLKSRDYLFAYFDGLNRYYVHNKHKVLIGQLLIQPNVFDNFVIYKKDE